MKRDVIKQIGPNLNEWTDLGLFDTLGNAEEWVENPSLRVVPDDDVEDKGFLTVTDQPNSRRLLRGASCLYPRADVYSAFRVDMHPGERHFTYGFRVARTLSDETTAPAR